MKRLVKQELLFLVDILPIIAPHTETWPVMLMHGRMRIQCSYLRTDIYADRSLYR